MDSHLIAGAYSQQFRQTDEMSFDSDRLEAFNKAKRLSQETNRRRKLQAQKRQQQTKREEQRRHDILTRRREEQRLATEKYQRYHLPPSARQNYRPASRTYGGTTLDTALQLIRGGIHHNRPLSSHERFLSLPDENVDLLESSLNKLRPHSSLPGSGRLVYQLDPKERAELMNYSKQNLTASRTLFEQQLEQQQSFLLEQKEALREFNIAVNNEIYGRKASGAADTQFDNNNDDDAGEKGEDVYHSDSCSSVDSLDDHKPADLHENKSNNTKHVTSPSGHTTVYIYHNAEKDRNINKEYVNLPQQQLKQEVGKQQLDAKIEQQNLTPLAVSSEQKDQNNLHYKNANSFTLSHNNGSLLDGAKLERGPILDSSNYIRQNKIMSQAAVASDCSALESNKVKNRDYKIEQKNQPVIKQLSTDSLDSGSSSSNKSMLKPQGLVQERANVHDNMYLQSTENGNNLSLFNINNNRIPGAAGINPNEFGGLHSEKNNFSGQTALLYTKQSQVAWVSPSQVETKSTATSGNENKQVDEHLQLHNSSGIATWPGSSTLSQIPTSVVNVHSYKSGETLKSTTMPASSTAALPSRFVPNSSMYTLAGVKIETTDTARTYSNQLSKDVPSTAVVNKNNEASYLNIMSSAYPQTDFQDHINTISNYNQKQVHVYNYLPKTHIPNAAVQQSNTGDESASNKQMNKKTAPFQTGSTAGSQGVNSLMHQDTQNYYKQRINDNALTGTAPLYDGRSNFPASRPPSPVTSSAIVTAKKNPPAVQTLSQLTSSVKETELIKTPNTRSNKNTSFYVAKENVEFLDEDPEEMPPLRGILKQTHTRSIPPSQEKAPTGGKPHVRDSLELAHLQNDKKSKKKSVRFAGQDQDDDDDNSEDRNSENQNDMNTGLSTYKTSFNRPVSGKTVSASNTETNTRVQRALSADAYRQQPVMSEHTQIRNVQLMSSSSVHANSSDDTNPPYTSILQERSNLPTSFVNPLNTTPIHRPKAAAHIIMGPDMKIEASKGHGDNYAGTASSYRSPVDTKIKPVNNNFMSKVPMKIPVNKESNIVVYNAVYKHADGVPNSYTNKVGANSAAEESVVQVAKEFLQQQNVDKPRNVYSNSKHVSFSNLGTTANVSPASKQAQFSPANRGNASFSTSSNNAAYEKGGIRVDRTPTDDEITWLWDKVRNCLSREVGNKSNLTANGSSDPGLRQPPTFSTKLIDGATLGLGTCSGASDGSTNVKSSPGVFQPQTVSVANPQNSIKAVLQPKGSYLRRYSLLKQRRANSASAVRSNTGSEGLRTNSGVYGRNSTIPLQQTSSAAGQQQLQDRPTPLMFGYRPQDEVSESTAAFVIAERLAKQSLSDSQIQMAMEDARNKQEAHNRSRMTITRNGHSALSIEEQKLLESLDRLNEKLKEPTYKASANHPEATQTHFPGFQGHRPLVDTRRHMLLSPGMIQRAQSARTRQQTYLYR